MIAGLRISFRTGDSSAVQARIRVIMSRSHRSEI